MKKSLLFLFILCLTGYCWASHLAGGYITYQHISGNTYEITIDIYRDCNSTATLPASYSVMIYNASNSFVTSVTASSVGGLQPVPGTNDPCVIVPPNFCLQKQTYKGTVTLTNSAGGFTMAINDFARNSGIINLLNPTSTSFLIFAKIPNPGSVINNNGPIFNNPPPPVVCVNTPMNFNYSATDPDGDSLVYSLCSARHIGAAGTGTPGPPPYLTVSYASGYSATYPMAASPAISIDPITGLMTGVPTSSGKYVVVVCIKEYRNGVLIGEYSRDAQFDVSSCTQAIVASSPGSSSTIGGGTPQILCKSTYTVNFTNTSTGSTNFRWDFGVPNINSDTSNLATPSYTYPDTGSYIVRLIAGPEMQCADTAYITVKVYPGLKSGYTYSGVLCTGNPIQFNDTSTSAYGSIVSTTWNFGGGAPPSTNPNPSVVFNFPVSFNVKLVIQDTKGCRDSTIKTILINASPTVNAGPDKDICVGGSTTIGQSVSGGVPSWSPATGLSCVNCATPTASPSVTTTYILTGTAGNGCTLKDTVTVTVHPTPVANAGPDKIVCNTGSVQLNGSSNITGYQTIAWTPGTGLSNPSILTPVANPAATTNYILTVTNAAGCSSKDTVTVFRNIFTVSAGPNTAVCLGDSAQLNATSAALGSYSWTPISGLSNPNIQNPKASPSSTTIYTVTLTDSAGCIASSTVTVTINTNNNVDAGLNQEICPGGSATLTATGGVNYTWDSHPSLSTTTTATTTASPTATTTYYVTGTSTVGCNGRDSVKVTVLPLPSISINAGSNPICEGTSTTITASSSTSGLSYNWTPATGLSCTTCPNPIATPASTTTYTVTATDSKGCSVTETITITVNPKPNVDAGNAFVGLCTGFSKTLTATGANSYSWSPTTGLSCTNCPSPVASPTSTITYTVVGVSANGCTASDTVRVEVQPTLPINVTPNDSICINGSMQLLALGGDTYLWSPAASLSDPNINNPVATPTATTTYTVSVSDLNGCSNSTTVTIDVNPLPTATASAADPSICEGTNTTLSATGGISYSWLPAASLNNANIANPVASPVTNTIYTVTVTDIKGCSNTATVSVNVVPKPVIDILPVTSTICIGDSVRLNASGGVSYNWSPATGLDAVNIADPWAFPSATTKYFVTGTDANGCQNNDSITVIVNSPPTITFSNPRQVCINDSLQITASGANTYTWSPVASVSDPNIANPYVNPTSTTTYTVVGSDGCTNTATVVVTVNPLPVITISAADTICSGSNTTLTATGGISYEWSPTAGLSCTNCQSPSASPTASTVYTVTVTDNNGCKDTASVSVTVNPLPTVSAGNNVNICEGDTIQLQASGASTYSWSPATSLDDPLVSNPLASPAATTVYTVTGTDAEGCENTSTVTVTVNTLPVVSITPGYPFICEGKSIKLLATGGNTYEWSPIKGLDDPFIADPIASPDSTTMYKVTVSNGCIVEDSVEVVVNFLPSVTVSEDTIVCLNEPVTLLAQGANDYTWSPAAGLDCSNCPTPIATPANTTSYIVTGTDANGCTGTDTVIVNVNIPMDPDIFPRSASICFGDSLEVSAINGISYEWSPAYVFDAPTDSSTWSFPDLSMDYIVKIEDINGCINYDTIQVEVNQPPVIDAGTDVSIYFGETVQLNASGGTSYTWEPGGSLNFNNIASPIAYPQDTTIFIVIGVDSKGCSGTDSVLIMVLGKAKVITPTAFSPNGDGHNDLFMVGMKDNFNMLSLRVYNRWGGLVFSSSDINEPWDGTFGGEPQPIGTYIFMIEGVDDLGKFVRKQGNLTLFR